MLQAWDEDEDGEWEAPLVANPKCATGGCGPWQRPNKKNPKYKGKFVPRQIPNPDYKVRRRRLQECKLPAPPLARAAFQLFFSPVPRGPGSRGKSPTRSTLRWKPSLDT